MTISFSSNYKSELDEIIEVLEEEAKTSSTEELIQAVQVITDAFVAQTGRRPSPTQLERLADVILSGDLTDSNSYKMTHNAEPIMSERQLTRRLEREWSQNDWNLNTNLPVVGFKVSHYTDDSGVMRKTRQPIYGKEDV